MRVKLEVLTSNGDCFIRVSKGLQEALGWAENDYLQAEISMTHPDQLLVYKVDKGLAKMAPTKQTDKSREYV